MSTPVLLFRTHKHKFLSISLLVGAKPNSLEFIGGCRRLVVTIGGEPVVHAGTLVNPEGTIGFFEWSGDDLSLPYTTRYALFTKFNARLVNEMIF